METYGVIAVIIIRIKEFIKNHLKVLIVVIAILSLPLIAATFSLSTLKLANYFVGRADYQRAIELYNLSITSSLNLNTIAKIRLESAQAEIALNTKLKEPAFVAEPLIIPLEQVVIKGKWVRNHTGSEVQEVVLSALLENTSEVGIPAVKVKKINIYDSNNQLVALKTTYQDLGPIVAKGQFPFSLYLILDKPNQISAAKFDLELEIPPFVKNERVHRLEVLNKKVLSKETSFISEEYYHTTYTFLVTTKNPTDQEISDIYKIAFLKHGDRVLNKTDDACCKEVVFTDTQKTSKVLSLDPSVESSIYKLNPGEIRDYQFKIATEGILMDSSINPEKIELVVYFIGSTK